MNPKPSNTFLVSYFDRNAEKPLSKIFQKITKDLWEKPTQPPKQLTQTPIPPKNRLHQSKTPTYITRSTSKHKTPLVNRSKHASTKSNTTSLRSLKKGSVALLLKGKGSCNIKMTSKSRSRTQSKGRRKRHKILQKFKDFEKRSKNKAAFFRRNHGIISKTMVETDYQSTPPVAFATIVESDTVKIEKNRARKKTPRIEKNRAATRFRFKETGSLAYTDLCRTNRRGTGGSHYARFIKSLDKRKNKKSGLRKALGLSKSPNGHKRTTSSQKKTKKFEFGKKSRKRLHGVRGSYTRDSDLSMLIFNPERLSQKKKKRVKSRSKSRKGYSFNKPSTVISSSHKHIKEKLSGFSHLRDSSQRKMNDSDDPSVWTTLLSRSAIKETLDGVDIDPGLEEELNRNTYMSSYSKRSNFLKKNQNQNLSTIYQKSGDLGTSNTSRTSQRGSEPLSSHLKKISQQQKRLRDRFKANQEIEKTSKKFNLNSKFLNKISRLSKESIRTPHLDTKAPKMTPLTKTGSKGIWSTTSDSKILKQHTRPQSTQSNQIHDPQITYKLPAYSPGSNISPIQESSNETFPKDSIPGRHHHTVNNLNAQGGKMVVKRFSHLSSEASLDKNGRGVNTTTKEAEEGKRSRERFRKKNYLEILARSKERSSSNKAKQRMLFYMSSKSPQLRKRANKKLNYSSLTGRGVGKFTQSIELSGRNLVDFSDSAAKNRASLKDRKLFASSGRGGLLFLKLQKKMNFRRSEGHVWPPDASVG